VRLTFEDGERAALLARLGLANDADDKALSERLATWVAEDPAQANNNNNSDVEGSTNNIDGEPTGDYVVVDVASYARMRRQESVAAEVVEAQRRRDRDELIEEAIHDGKFGPGRRDHYRARYDSDPEGTTALLGQLARNTVPLEARGADAPTDQVDDDAYPLEWVKGGNAYETTTEGSGGGKPVRRNRVHSE
jgi:hypothetical protein